MNLAEMQARRAQARLEFDSLKWRHQRNSERLDRLAKELEHLDIEIVVAKFRERQPPVEIVERELVKMEIVEV